MPSRIQVCGTAKCVAMGLGMVFAGSLPLQGQAAASSVREEIAPSQRVLLSSGGAAPASAYVPGQVVREIDDPFNGARWLLIRDRDSAAGPRRLVLIESGREELPRTLQVSAAAGLPGAAKSSIRPAIRAGDRLVVEENTAVVVRLQIGGRVVRAVALAPGRAALVTQDGGQP
jgi:hypothetical protein